MTSGANRTPGMFVERQTTRPEQCLTPAAPGYKKGKHANLSFIEYVEGMLGKFLMETPADKLDPMLANKLTYLRNMISMHHTLDLRSLLSISDRFLTVGKTTVSSGLTGAVSMFSLKRLDSKNW